MSALIGSLLGNIWPYLAGAAVLLLGIWRMRAGAKKAGINEQKAKQQEADRANIERIKRAGDAGAAIRPDDPGVSNDPHDLDH